MPIVSVRLDTETAALLERIAGRCGKTKSEVLREAIAGYARRGADGSADERPYRKIEHLIGCVATGQKNLSQRTGERFAELLKMEKHGRRSRRRGSARRADR